MGKYTKSARTNLVRYFILLEKITSILYDSLHFNKHSFRLYKKFLPLQQTTKLNNYTTLADNDLLKEIGRYNSRALEELYNRYSATFYTLIKKIAPDQKTAENILVEVFAIIWRKASMFDYVTGNAFTWLITLARNRAIDTVRRSRSTESLDHYDDKYEDFYIIPTLDPNIDDLDIQSAKEFKPKIEKALAKLSDAQKYVIHLAYYEGFTLNEIADRLNIPLETVRNKVMIAFHNLKDYLIAEMNSG